MSKFNDCFRVLLVTLLITSCSSKGNSESGFRKVRIDEDLTISVPVEMHEVPVQAIDSLVKEYRATDAILTVDYGPFSGNPSLPQNAAEASIRSLSVSGHPARISRFRLPSGSDFPYVSRIGVQGIRDGKVRDGLQSTENRKDLVLTVRCKTEKCHERSESLFHGIEISP